MRTVAAERMTFEEWMHAVDVKVTDLVGVSVYDLPDCLYRDWYDDGMAPDKAATQAIRASF